MPSNKLKHAQLVTIHNTAQMNAFLINATLVYKHTSKKKKKWCLNKKYKKLNEMPLPATKYQEYDHTWC